MQTQHKPVMLKEVLHYLVPQKNQNYIDGTVGGGGHTEALLRAIAPEGKVLALDWDGSAIARTKERLKEFKDRLILANETYTNLEKIVYDQKFEKVSGILLDLGLSSDQLQNSGRGFSFQLDEPLDMRFDPDQNNLTAEQIINAWSADELMKILRDYAEEKSAFRIIQAICEARKEKEIKTTGQLVDIILQEFPRRGKIHPATKTFQALRIAVNQELENVKRFLESAGKVLEVGGRLAVITFHSLEDRIVKQYFKQESLDCRCPREIPICQCGHKAIFKIITKKPILPSAEEVKENFRARSAKLRVVEKV
ncbi:MAG: Ribosomal RNA small subunit methyltransferase H [Parcubacteria group bacterium GW2011_GWC2_38_7]|nr:MAG: Ribosomal RNA small subunit methyltransferase H [Parcubacteria group bacterium GW2011_GWC2_38_7]